MREFFVLVCIREGSFVVLRGGANLRMVSNPVLFVRKGQNDYVVVCKFCHFQERVSDLVLHLQTEFLIILFYAIQDELAKLEEEL